MVNWPELLDHWSNLSVAEIVSIIYFLHLILLVININNIFQQFVASKPEGRKTAMGELDTFVTYNSLEMLQMCLAWSWIGSIVCWVAVNCLVSWLVKFWLNSWLVWYGMAWNHCVLYF